MNQQAQKEWETVEWIIESHLRKADREIQKFHGRAALFGVNRERRNRFIEKKMPELLKRVTEG